MFEILRNAPKVKSFFNKVEGYVILTKRDSGDFKKIFRTAVGQNNSERLFLSYKMARSLKQCGLFV